MKPITRFNLAGSHRALAAIGICLLFAARVHAECGDYVIIGNPLALVDYSAIETRNRAASLSVYTSQAGHSGMPRCHGLSCSNGERNSNGGEHAAGVPAGSGDWATIGPRTARIVDQNLMATLIPSLHILVVSRPPLERPPRSS